MDFFVFCSVEYYTKNFTKKKHTIPKRHIIGLIKVCVEFSLYKIQHQPGTQIIQKYETKYSTINILRWCQGEKNIK